MAGDDSNKVGLGALAALVVGLGVVVWLAMPKDSDLAAAADAGPSSALGGEGGAARRDESGKPSGTLERLPEASAELAVLTDKPEVEVAAVASAEAIAKMLDTRHCGATCDALRKVMTDRDRFEVEMTKSEDYILPAKDSYETIAAGLTHAERASITTRGSTVVIRTRGSSTIDQLPARLAFAATYAVAEALSGLVYDEVVRRIETPEQLAQRVITVPLGQNVFTPRHISVQLYRQEDGTARLLTLGMVRFGSPDFTMRGSSMEAGPPLANVLNAAASWAASAKTELPVVVTLADVARVSAHAPEDLAKDPNASSPIRLDALDTERIEGDPENEMLELVPHAGATRAAWDSVVAELFGATPKVVFATFDKELEAIAVRARKDLPGAVKRFEAGEGALFVKGPFPIPEASRFDGGAKDEWMWIDVSACDAKGCNGTLSSSPGYATNLSAGKPVAVEKSKTADWLLKLKDGGTTGGESIKALQRRAH
ncbi:MAG: hypothetical protein JWP87_4941 [Labilithrix sp.]|nr:hypothetical protein [Labilithrix sp.]